MSISVRGLKNLGKRLEKCTTTEPIKRIVQTNADRMNANMKKNTQTAFTKGYSQGTTARSINTLISDGGMTASVGPTTDYAGYVEHGTRYMDAEPFIKPALEAQKNIFLQDLGKICE